MLKHHVRNAALAATALVAALSLTACNGTDDAGSASTPKGSASSAPAKDSGSGGTAATPAGSDGTSSAKGSSSGGSSGSGSSGSGSSGSAGGTGGTGDKSDTYGQTCGTNDLTWSARSESQAGGYILVTAKAKAGITCILAGGHPTIAFGSDGTEAGPAEQAVGQQITLSGSKVVYAGVNPKTTNTNDGKELNFIIASVSDQDPNPVDLRTGKILVDKPVVTNWHTSPADAVPGV